MKRIILASILIALLCYAYACTKQIPEISQPPTTLSPTLFMPVEITLLPTPDITAPLTETAPLQGFVPLYPANLVHDGSVQSKYF